MKTIARNIDVFRVTAGLSMTVYVCVHAALTWNIVRDLVECDRF